MMTATKPLLTLCAEEVMSRDVVTIPHTMSLRAAARVLRRNQISGAPVVDELGRCVGVLSATDVLHWVEKGCPETVNEPPPACTYQIKGRLLTGEPAVICTLAEGTCPLQVMHPTTGGRHVATCLQPRGILNDWQQTHENEPADSVARYVTTDLVTAEPLTPVVELARRMFEAHIHRIPVLDEQGRPVGVVTSTDILAALALKGG